MARILVDSNVVLDLLTSDSAWYAWSSSTIEQYADTNVLVVNPLVYAEISVRFSRIEDLEAVLAATSLERMELPWEAAFLAGKCFVHYRRRGGVRTSPLPDFFIGAHASVANMPLITRDAARYRTYFPKLRVIAPDTN